ncbi:MAG: bifunctional phosphopantothenoylcysteine decarboxylase/phosphopantothenate--cysteine ligase CoaBC [Hyphomicrobiaceae bacterium]
MSLGTKRILLIISGGIAAYKCLELIRRARDAGFSVRVVMTKAATQFVTPLSVGGLSSERVFTSLFDLDEEREIGHIRLARDTDLVVVAPATADLLAKMAGGHADDLASAVLLATDKPVLAAPAMNPRMWMHSATRRNHALLQADGIHFVGPETGEMAESGEAGVGRMAEPMAILAAVQTLVGSTQQRHASLPLRGRHILVTSGPTHEPIDPVRYIANRSSGKQGSAIAAAAARLGARVTLVTGPTSLPDPNGVTTIHVETAEQMLSAVRRPLGVDVAIFAAAVADWRVANASDQKIKKNGKQDAPSLVLVENPDILKTIAHEKPGVRPALVIGFAAETQNVIELAKKKRKAKGCDWIIANDVSPRTGVMGGDRNAVHLISASAVDSWPEMDKTEVAERLLERIVEHLAANTGKA